MAKKQWEIKNVGRKCFSLNRCGASFEFNKIGESKLYRYFYHGECYIGKMLKSKNEIVNLDDFLEETN